MLEKPYASSTYQKSAIKLEGHTIEAALCPMLFKIFINYLDHGMENTH